MAPVFARLGKQYRKRMPFIAINASDRPDMAKRFGVSATPTFILVRNGKALRRFHGNIPEPVLKQYLEPFAPPPSEDDEEEEQRGGLLSRIFGRRN
ncbi:MAG: thioredoxin family protein [Chloroflexi bacterium]|nr:thioredoxin family protein [Chloroflexota bacterium]